LRKRRSMMAPHQATILYTDMVERWLQYPMWSRAATLKSYIRSIQQIKMNHGHKAAQYICNKPTSLTF
jgi:hypothetical protein